MTLKEFILSAPKQEDESINYVLDLLTSLKDLPENVKTISKAIYLKLNPQQTQAFQKIIMMYYFTENNYQQPTAQNLDEINFIVTIPEVKANIFLRYSECFAKQCVAGELFFKSI